MYDSYLHAYEKISLSTAGIIMGLILILAHLIPLLQPQATLHFLTRAHRMDTLAQTTLGIALGWFMLLMVDAQWNPLTTPLYEFEGIRNLLVIACPVVWFILSSMVKENLFPRALGLLILLAVSVPLTAAFLKDPATRLLIPIWCYPALTIAMFWVAKPYLFRDWMSFLSKRPALFRGLAALGTAYGVAILLCAIIFW